MRQWTREEAEFNFPTYKYGCDVQECNSILGIKHFHSERDERAANVTKSFTSLSTTLETQSMEHRQLNRLYYIRSRLPIKILTYNGAILVLIAVINLQVMFTIEHEGADILTSLRASIPQLFVTL